jgi:hypothetical protein
MDEIQQLQSLAETLQAQLEFIQDEMLKLRTAYRRRSTHHSRELLEQLEKMFPTHPEDE